jgi:hypothetical protein
MLVGLLSELELVEETFPETLETVELLPEVFDELPVEQPLSVSSVASPKTARRLVRADTYNMCMSP